MRNINYPAVKVHPVKVRFHHVYHKTNDYLDLNNAIIKNNKIVSIVEGKLQAKKY